MIKIIYAQIISRRGEMLKNILIIGTNHTALKCMEVITSMTNMNIIAIIKVNKDKQALGLAKTLHINVEQTLTPWISKDLDYIFETTGNEQLAQEIKDKKSNNSIIVPAETLQMIAPFTNEFSQHLGNLELLLNNIRDGLIAIDAQQNIQLMNKTAAEIIEIDQREAIGNPIQMVVKNSRLPKILQHHRKEVNQPLTLENGKEIVVTRIPLINEKNRLIGAFAVFKDRNEVLSLAEENTDLKEIKTMLEAIIHSSDEAISVVDEEGKGLIINPAYTRITGLSDREVIGKPASVDISEGESMHVRVLETRRPVRRARMKVGPYKKEVLVNVAPIIVAGKLKGSVAVIHDVSEIESLTNELKKARQMIRNLEASYTFTDIIGNSSEMTIAIEQAKIGAKTEATVLLRGASGTGKELFAHAIHNESDRKYNKFICVNCTSIATSSIEKELFGYESGKESETKKGIFEKAHRGSVFLDEIGELDVTTQAKLLRLLQHNEIVRVGGTTPISIDVRVIAATNINLEKAITHHSFQEDLYYRLNRLPIYIPSLNERLSDLPALIQYMITKVNQLYGRQVHYAATDTIEQLKEHHWPGNIRELENVIARAIISMDMKDEVIEVYHLPELKRNKLEEKQVAQESMDTERTLQEAMDQCERQYIEQVYDKHEQHKTKTAKHLNISVRSLYYKLEKYGIN